MVQSIKVYDTNCYRSSEEREDNPLLLLYQYSLDFWKLLKQKKKELSCVLIMCVCVCVCVYERKVRMVSESHSFLWKYIRLSIAFNNFPHF